jgi:Tol biopolymer transport system component
MKVASFMIDGKRYIFDASKAKSALVYVGNFSTHNAPNAPA